MESFCFRKTDLFLRGMHVDIESVRFDIQKEHERMEKLGVVFRTKPTKMGPTTLAVFDDTCGNYIQIYQI